MSNLKSIGYEPSPPTQVCGCFFAVAGFVVGPIVALMLNVALYMRHRPPPSCGMWAIPIMALGAILGFYLGSIAGRVLGDVMKRRRTNAPPPSPRITGFRVAPLGAICGVFLGSLAWSSIGYPGLCEFGEGLVRRVAIALAILGGVTSFLLAHLWAVHERTQFDLRAATLPEVERD